MNIRVNARKPVLQVKGNKILVAWTSKYARGGKPRYTIDVCPADEPVLGLLWLRR